MDITPFLLAQRYIGIKEISGPKNHPLIQWWGSLCGFGLEMPDEVAWCSIFANGILWELRLPRSKSAAARSNLTIGIPIAIADARPGFDLAIIKRGTGVQPGPEVTSGAPGHVGFFAGVEGDSLLILGGNQGDSVSIERFPLTSLLGIRRVA